MTAFFGTPETHSETSDRQPTRELALFLLISSVTTILCVTRIAESDIWYHLRNAREIVQRGAVPRFDTYTFTSAGAPLIDYEWMSELVYLFAFERWGQHGLLAVYTTLIVASYWLVYRLAIRRGANATVAALITVCGIALGSFSFGPRMMHFGWFCLVLVLWVLDAGERRTALLWLLPLIFCLWINLHGSWPFGLVMVGAMIAEWAVRLRRQSLGGPVLDPKVLRVGIAAAGVSIVALFANPYGLSLLLYPFDLMTRQKYAVSVVHEWGPLDFGSPYGRLALVMFTGLALVIWRGKKPWRISEVLLGCFALWAAVRHQRFLGFATFVLIPIVAPHIRALTSRRTPLLDTTLAVALAIVLVNAVPSRQTLDAHIDTQFPRHALAFMVREGINGRLFNMFDFGGFIEWHAPRLKTFADGRADIFTYNGVLRDYMDAIWANRTLEVLDKYQIEYVLVPPHGVIPSTLRQTTGWTTVYADEVAVLFTRGPDGPGVSR
jgi:hypothetical protein